MPFTYKDRRGNSKGSWNITREEREEQQPKGSGGSYIKRNEGFKWKQGTNPEERSRHENKVQTNEMKHEIEKENW